MATGSEMKPADYTPLTRPGHNAEIVLEVAGLQTYLFTRLGVVKGVITHTQATRLVDDAQDAISVLMAAHLNRLLPAGG